MKNQNTTATGKDASLYTAFLTMVAAATIGLLVLDPLWAQYSPPFEIPKVIPAVTAPVDGPFYLRNADEGYHWHTRDPLSLWFHPLMSWLVQAEPKWLPTSMRFWLTSLAFGIGSLVLIHKLTSVLVEETKTPSILLFLTLLAPGGLGMATGNAEIPTLFFSTALMLSVLYWNKWWLTIFSAVLAILTKPNALYMVPVLSVYLISGWLKRNTDLWKQSALGLTALLVGWAMWMAIVDCQAGQFGVYWNARLLSREYVAGAPWAFFDQLARAFIYDGGIREQIRYSTALIIPLVNLWVISLLPLSHEHHRYALAAGNLAMLAIALYLGNPNKIIVYATTLPGHFAMHILLFKELLARHSALSVVFRPIAAILYTTYCACLLIVYLLGTPLGWYY